MVERTLMPAVSPTPALALATTVGSRPNDASSTQRGASRNSRISCSPAPSRVRTGCSCTRTSCRYIRTNRGRTFTRSRPILTSRPCIIRARTNSRCSRSANSRADCRDDGRDCSAHGHTLGDREQTSGCNVANACLQSGCYRALK